MTMNGRESGPEPGDKVWTADGFRATYVAYRPDLGGYVVAMDDYRCTPGEQFVTATVTERSQRADEEAEAAIAAVEREIVAGGGCPCICNVGGFCGGCGHAGCGRR